MRWTKPAALALATAGALAQAGEAVPPQASVQASAPVMREGGGIKYLSGGAGEEERQQMQAQAEHFPLQIVFSGKGGAYAVPDSVSVSNRAGALLSIPSAGPWLMLNLPPGAYVVKASFGAFVQERALSVDGKPQKLGWTAPAVNGP